MTHRIFIFCLLICIFSCNKEKAKVIFDKKENHPYIEISIKELKTNYKKYDGKWVKVTDGFVNIRFERSILQPQLKEDVRNISDIWVWYPNKGFDVSEERINRKKVVLKGFFTTSSKGHLGMYPGALQDITYIAVYE